MLKFTLLATFLITACATDTDLSEQQGALGSKDDDCEPEGPSCVDKGVVVFLDDAPANVDDNDRKVTYCHATSSAENPYVVITTSVSACTAHEEHEHLEKGGHLDIFPTGGCED